MTTETAEPEVELEETLEQEPEQEQEVKNGEEGATAEHDETEEAEELEEGEIEYSFEGEESQSSEDDEEAGENAPGWIKQLRKDRKEDRRRIRELEAKLKENTKVEEEILDPGPRPKAEDFNYDDDQHAKAMDAWYAKKQQAEALKAEKQKARQAEEERFSSKMQAYEEGVKKLNAEDFEDSYEAVMQHLDQTQRSIIIEGAADSAKLVHALGKSEKRLKELSQLKNPIEFAWRMAQLEKGIKETRPRRVKTEPEKKVGGKPAGSGAVDSTLEQLRAEAAKTNDSTKVVRYLARKKKEARSK